MISCDKGQIKLRGSKSNLMAEFTCIVNTLLGNDDGKPVMTDEELDKCIDMAKMSDEELDDGIKSMADKMSPEQLLGALFDTLADLKDM